MRAAVVAIIGFILVAAGFIGWNINYANQTRIPTPPAHLYPTPGNIFTQTTVTTTNTTSGQTLTSSPPVNRIDTPWGKEWLTYANIAWQYYTPGFGVDSSTGLLYASQSYDRFTDWDLAGYINAILAAEEIGLVNKSGTWGADYRLDLVLNFLGNRTLVPSLDIPYQFYDATTGQKISNDNIGNPADEGRLLIALHDATLINPEFIGRIDSVVGRVNYAYLEGNSFFDSDDVYSVYCAEGFDLWGYPTILPPTNSTGQAPGSSVIPEPVMLSLLENVANPYMTATGQMIENATYSLYNGTGRFYAFGEGGYPSNPSGLYVYEWVEIPDGTSYSVVSASGQTLNLSPETFTKIGFAMLAIYNSTYPQELVNNISSTMATPHGYSDAFVVGTNQIVSSTSGGTENMIMEAAVYAIYAPY